MLKKRGESPQGVEVKKDVPEEHLIQDGKFRELYERIGQRRVRKWCPEYKAYKVKAQESADLSDVTSESLQQLETCSRGTITKGDVTAYIVRYSGGDAEGVYGIEIMRGTERLDSFYDDIDVEDLMHDVKRSVEKFAKPVKKTATPNQTLADSATV